MLRRLKDAVKATPLAIPFIWTKGLIRQPASQNVREDLLLPGERVLDPAEAYQARHADKWSKIEHLPFVTV